LNADSRANAIYNHPGYGPVFGSGNDLLVYNQCNLVNHSSVNLGNSYRNDSGLAGTAVLTGAQKFTVQEIEVFEMVNST
jgi:hypothetical protein